MAILFGGLFLIVLWVLGMKLLWVLICVTVGFLFLPIIAAIFISDWLRWPAGLAPVFLFMLLVVQPLWMMYWV